MAKKTEKSLVLPISDTFWIIFGYMRGSTGQLRAPLIFKNSISTYNYISFKKKSWILDVCWIYSLIITHFRNFFPILGLKGACTGQVRDPFLEKNCISTYNYIFVAKKKEKLNAQIDIYPENHSFWPFQPHFGQFLGIWGAPTGQLRAPLIFKNLFTT